MPPIKKDPKVPPKPGATPTATRTNPMEVPATVSVPVGSKPGLVDTSGANDFYKTYPATLTYEDKLALQQRMADVGAYKGIKKPWIKGFWNPDVDGKAFKKIVDLAYANGAVTGKTPNFNYIIDLAKADPATYSTVFSTGLTGGYQGPTTSVSISDVKYDAAKLEQAANAAYRQAVGRDATADELAQAVAAVNQGYAKNPTKTTTVTSKNKLGQTVSRSSTTGGIDAGQILEQQAESNPEFANYQAATTYFDAMLKAMRGPVGQGA